MEDTKKTKKPASKNKNKNNYEPKWKSKKESKATKTTEAPVKSGGEDGRNTYKKDWKKNGSK